MVCKLHKSIYGLKQVSYSWNKHFDQATKSFNFNQNEDEPCVYKKVQESMVVLMILCVNDILLIGNDGQLLSLVKIQLSTQFKMKDLRETQYILGVKVHRDHKNRKLALSQATYIDKLLVKYMIQNSKKCLLPFMHGVPYASIVGCLMYAMLCTRLDIFFAMGMMSRN